MSFAFGHLIGAWICGKIYEYHKRCEISHLTWFFLLFGAILPDIDFLVEWGLGMRVHRTFTHSFLFILLIGGLTYLFFTKVKKDPLAKTYAVAFSFGIFTHLFLDFWSSHGIPLFWPYPTHFSWTGIHNVMYTTTSFLNRDLAQLRFSLKVAVLDMGLGTAWLFYLWWKKRVKF